MSAVLPVRDGAAGLRRAVEALLTQDYPGPFEVVVAVAPSSDDTAHVAAELATDERVRIVDNPSGGTSSGLNAAIAAAAGEVIVRCDHHAAFPPDYVRRAVEILDETAADNVGGIQAARGEGFWQRAVSIAQTTPLGVGDARYRRGGPPGPVDTVYLGVYRREVIDRLGGFDESQVRNQDYEFNWRIRRAGGTVYFHPDLVVEYRPRGSLGALWRQYWQYGKWKARMIRRNPRSVRWRQLAAPGLVAALIASAVLAVTPWRMASLAVPAVYAAAVLLTALVEGLRRRDLAAVGLIATLPTMHLAWGGGFLFGRTQVRATER